MKFDLAIPDSFLYGINSEIEWYIQGISISTGLINF